MSWVPRRPGERARFFDVPCECLWDPETNLHRPCRGCWPYLCYAGLHFFISDPVSDDDGAVYCSEECRQHGDWMKR